MLLDLVEESLLAASDEEIMEDILLEGRDSEQIADSVSSMINAQIKTQQQKKLQAARGGYNLSSRKKRSILTAITNPVERRSLLNQILSTRDDLSLETTMAFRKGKEMSDDDVASILEDFEELGLLDDEE